MPRIPIYRDPRPLTAGRPRGRRPLVFAAMGGATILVLTGATLGQGFGVVPTVGSTVSGTGGGPQSLVPHLLRTLSGAGTPGAPELAVETLGPSLAELLEANLSGVEADASGSAAFGLLPAGGDTGMLALADLNVVDLEALDMETDEPFDAFCEGGDRDDGCGWAFHYEAEQDAEEGESRFAGAVDGGPRWPSAVAGATVTGPRVVHNISSVGHNNTSPFAAPPPQVPAPAYAPPQVPAKVYRPVAEPVRQRNRGRDEDDDEPRRQPQLSNPQPAAVPQPPSRNEGSRTAQDRDDNRRGNDRRGAEARMPAPSGGPSLAPDVTRQQNRAQSGDRDGRKR